MHVISHLAARDEEVAVILRSAFRSWIPWRDPFVLAAGAVTAVFTALYALPFVPYATLLTFVTVWADPILILLAICAFLHGRRHLHPEERNFWTLMTAAFVCSTGGTWLPLFVPGAEWRALEQVSEDIVMIMQFVFLFVALSLNPHSDESNWSINSLRFRLESAGTISFAVLMLAYFVLVPLYYGSSSDPALPKAMHIALGAMLIFSFVYIASFSNSERWTRIYRLMATGLTFWFVADAVELIIVLDIWHVPGGIPYGTAYDFLWYAPFLFAVVAARTGREDAATDAPPDPLPQRNPRQIRYLFGPLAVYTTSLPLIHFALSTTGLLEDATRGPRETAVFFGLILLGSLTLVNEKLIERQRRRTEQENKRLAAFPIKNPNPFLTFSNDGSLKFMNPAASATVKRLGLDSIADFLPPNHARLVDDCMLTRSGYRDIEAGVAGRHFSYGYYPNPSGSDVFVYVMDVTERKLAEGKLRHDALHDTLTGLPNRTLVMEILQRAVDRAQRNDDYQFAVLFLDLNRFKLVNDSLGHLAGDRFLVEISHRLSRCLRSNDVVGRFGGDEFVIVVDDLKDAHQATRTAVRIQEELSRPLLIGDQEIVTSACIGIALSAVDRTQPEHYLRDADIAMYRAKKKDVAGFEVFDSAMHEDAVARLRLETELRHAVEADQLRLYYQPYVSLDNGDTLGFEALIRWQHPEDGMVSPGCFIPLAEDTGLIQPIGWWVLETACAQLAEWQRSFGETVATLSLNVSSKQLSEADFVAKVEAVLARHQIERSRLCLEITESVISDIGEGVIDILHGLKTLGVRLAIDDFGTGYSSLSYVGKFPADIVKIDRSFVREVDGRGASEAIVRAILAMASDLGMSVIAEGIERPEQAQRLRALGCRMAQGFLFSKPVERSLAEEMLVDAARAARPRAS